MTEEYDVYRRSQSERWLEHVRGLGNRIRTLQSEIEAQRDIAAGVQAVCYDGMPKSPNSSADAIPNAVAAIEELIAEYATELAGYVEEQREAHDALRMMEDGVCRDALTKYYVLGRSWKSVCYDEKGNEVYTYDGIMSIRRRGLLKAYDVMPTRWRDPAHPAI